jgi:hypothetical protein
MSTSPRRAGERSRHSSGEDPWWDYAQGCANALAHGLQPPEQPVYGPLLAPGETARLTAPAHYSRLQPGHSNDRPPAAPILAANPVMMLGSFAAQSVINTRRARSAARNQQPDWRLQRATTVITTSQRLMCDGHPAGGWTSFWYQDFADFQPDVTARTLIIGFTDGHCAPLRLTGAAVPAISLWSAHAVYGAGCKYDPRLRALLTPPPAEHTVDHNNPTPEMLRRTGYPDADTYRWAYRHTQTAARATQQDQAQRHAAGGLSL